MSTNTIDRTIPHALTSKANDGFASLARALAGLFDSLGRAVEASNLVERGVDPLEAYNRVYKAMPLRDL